MPPRCRSPTRSYDVVLSAIGAMFAPDHQATADELVRVCRSGGTVAMANWTAGGGAGRFFDVLALVPTARHRPDPPRPTGPTRTTSPRSSGTRVDLVTEADVVDLDFDGGPDELAELYLTSFPPVVVTLAGLRPGAERAGRTRRRPDDVLPRRVRRVGRGPVRLPAGPGDRGLTRASRSSRQCWPTRS